VESAEWNALLRERHSRQHFCIAVAMYNHNAPEVAFPFSMAAVIVPIVGYAFFLRSCSLDHRGLQEAVGFELPARKNAAESVRKVSGNQTWPRRDFFAASVARILRECKKR